MERDRTNALHSRISAVTELAKLCMYEGAWRGAEGVSMPV